MDFKPFKIGKYLLLERLATGGMAEVYRAKASGAGGFEKQLAVKRILPTYSTNEEFRRMFEYEARLSSMLTHANIVQIYDFVKSGDTYLLAMEYVDGKNLRQFINKAKKVSVNIAVEFAVYVINEVCKGLEYAHKKKDDLNGRPLNIIHRDMSPQNIMLSYEGAVKIVDFGIAKAKDRVDETRSGVIKGKFGYMSPEQANGESVDHRTDIFSTGIILFELLTGRRLFSADNDMATLKLIQGCVIPPPARINPKISSELEKILLRSLTKDLALRYQSAGSFHRALQEYLNKYYPSYTQKEVADVLQKVFQEEIENEKRRFEQIYRQSIPFSQGARKEEGTNFDEIEEILDGEITKSEVGENTAVTFASEDEASNVEAARDADPRATEGTAVADPAGELGTGADSTLEDEAERSVSAPKPRPQPKARPKPREETFVEDLREEEAEAEAERSITKSDHSIAASLSATQVPAGKPLRRLEPPPEPEEPSEPLDPNEKMPTLAAEPNLPRMGDEEPSTRNAPSAPAPAREEARVASVPRRMEPPMSREPREMSQRGPAIEVRRHDRAYLDDYGSDPGPREKLALEAPREGRRAARSYYTDRDYFRSRPSRNTTVLSFLMFVGLLAGTVYVYSIYLDNQLPWLPLDPNRHPNGTTTSVTSGARSGTGQAPAPGGSEGAAPTRPRQPPPRKPVASEDCTVEVDSDPVGAQVIVNGVVKGTTSTLFASPCNRSLDLTLKLDGYETVNENIVVRERLTRRYKSLKRIPMGAIELTLNRNAKVYVNNEFKGEARALQKFSIPLVKGKYRVRFVNEIFGIDTVRDFSVEENEITRRSIELEEPLPSIPRSRRR